MGRHVKEVTNAPSDGVLYGGSVALPLSVEPYSIEDDEWRDHAACRDTNPDLFFPVGTTGPAIEQIAQAKAVCCECPSQAPCLEFALMTNQDSGVWGGTSEEERRKIRKQWLARHRRAS
jgi:WhiB family redox-sensing transcriptional regulator